MKQSGWHKMAEGETSEEGSPVSSTSVDTSELVAEGGLAERFAVLQSQFLRELWALRPSESSPRRWLRGAAQLVALTIRGFYADQLLLRASALTYVTALSIIPMLGVVFSIVGAVGGDETLIDFAIDQLTTVAPEVRETVREFATKLDFASFGTVGGAVLFGTTIFALTHSVD